MRLLAASILLFTASTSSAVIIDGIDDDLDIPGYAFTATATGMRSSASFITNLASAEVAMTDLATTSYILSRDATANVDLTFGNGIDNNMILHNGSGTDLSVFLVGNSSHVVTMSLFEDGSSLGAGPLSFNTSSYTGFCIDDGSGSCEPGSTNDLPIFVMNINFDSFGITDAEIDMIRLDIGGPSASPSLVGAYYASTAVTVIPLPLPALLFASGLALLGAIARKRR